MSKPVISPVWNIHKLVGPVTPGLLICKDGNISFVTEEATCFNEPIANLKEITWPMLRMGLGFDTVVNGSTYKFSFTKPNPSARELDQPLIDQLLRLSDLGRLLDSIKTLANLKADKETVRQWKKILSGNKN